jgi:hypothetical protein
MLLTTKSISGYTANQVYESTHSSGSTAPDSQADFLRLVICSTGGMGQVVILSTSLLSGFQHPAHPHLKVRIIKSLNSRSKIMSNSIALTIASKSIRQFNHLYSLNDLHQASGGEEKYRPNQFIRLDQTKALIDEIFKCADLRIYKEPVKTIKGKYGGTYVCKELVYAYAMWISPKFNLAVIRAFDSMTAQALPTTITPAQQSELQAIVADKSAGNGKLSFVNKWLTNQTVLGYSVNTVAKTTVEFDDSSALGGQPPILSGIFMSVVRQVSMSEPDGRLLSLPEPSARIVNPFGFAHPFDEGRAKYPNLALGGYHA